MWVSAEQSTPRARYTVRNRYGNMPMMLPKQLIIYVIFYVGYDQRRDRNASHLSPKSESWILSLLLCLRARHGSSPRLWMDRCLTSYIAQFSN
ncbi:hypothetical protein K449DRAFT_252232 [Hypoxylon sp. EC38]|nr:hypothetical protein K449DRAFT_252232 [Hypoxylon sp. EC38]